MWVGCIPLLPSIVFLRWDGSLQCHSLEDRSQDLLAPFVGRGRAGTEEQPLLPQEWGPLPHCTTSPPWHFVYHQYCLTKAGFSSPQRQSLLPAIVIPNTSRPLSPCFGTIPAIAKHKHYVPPSTNYSFQELQFYFGYKHTKVTFMLGEEEPRKRPHAEPLLCREHSWEHFAALPPAGSSSQAVALPKRLHDIRAEVRAKMPCGGQGSWRDLLQSKQSMNWDSERERNALKSCFFSYSWHYWQPMHSGQFSRHDS